MFQCLLPGHIPFLHGVRGFGCRVLLCWKDWNAWIQQESTAGSWAALNVREILSSECSTAQGLIHGCIWHWGRDCERGCRTAQVWLQGARAQECGITLNVLSLTVLITLLVTAECRGSVAGWNILQLYRSFVVPGDLVCLSGGPRGISCKSIFLAQERGVQWTKKNVCITLICLCKN